MAKKRRSFGKKGSFRGFSRKRSRSSGSSDNMMTVGLAAVAYGAGRPYVENLIAPLTSKIPIGGQYVDELVLGTVGYMAAKGKFGSNKYIKSIGKAMFIVEATRVGSTITSAMANGNSNSGNPSFG